MSKMPRESAPASGQSGFTLIEMMITMALTLIIMASTLAAMNNAIRASEVATLTTNMNQGLRTAMDIIVRDILQVGQGLPSGRTIDIPNGAGVTAVKLPGAPATSPVTSSPAIRTIPTTATEMTALLVGAGIGPTINGVATDVITMVQADGAFLSTISDYDVNLTALNATSMTVDPAVDISNGGADDLHVGDLIMLQKSTSSTLVQITALDGVQTATFGASDSLNLNQTAAAFGTLTKHVATAPLETQTAGFVPSTATRIRLVSYYIDAVTDPTRPRLVRRINNGSATTYDNSSGTAVAFDVENLQITYDLVDGVGNPSNVKMNAADLAGTTGGACAPFPCSPNQIRKINVTISGRSRTPMRQTRKYLRNTLTTQVSLRSMSFIDRYR
jgi:prepilin-type N-terminal cleavage/methylation domain-containing protein